MTVSATQSMQRPLIPGEHVNPTLNEIKLIVWNIQGIGTQLENEDVQQLFDNDVVVLLETMKPGHFKIDIPTHTLYHFPRGWRHQHARRSSGGLAVFIRNSIKKCVTVRCNKEIIAWISIAGKYTSTGKQVHIGFVYIPPQCSTYMYTIT